VKNKTNHENLLDAVLLETPAQEASLRVVRRAARQRRWSRHLRHGVLVVMALWIGLLLLQPKRAGDKPAKSLAVREASHVVHSRALPEGFMIHTDRKSVSIVTTTKSGVEIFSTGNTPSPERIDDEILLQLAPGAVLVWDETGPAKLLFPNRPDPGSESRAHVE
jgi:hypothetical protein